MSLSVSGVPAIIEIERAWFGISALTLLAKIMKSLNYSSSQQALHCEIPQYLYLLDILLCNLPGAITENLGVIYCQHSNDTISTILFSSEKKMPLSLGPEILMVPIIPNKQIHSKIKWSWRVYFNFRTFFFLNETAYCLWLVKFYLRGIWQYSWIFSSNYQLFFLNFLKGYSVVKREVIVFVLPLPLTTTIK